MTVLDPPIPDAEALLSQFLRAQEEIEDAVAERVYTVIPKTPTWPLLRLSRVAGVPRLSRPLVIDNPLIQVEAYGGSKREAHDLAELARSAIAARIIGAHDLGLVTGYSFGTFAFLADDSYTPSRPRYIADVSLTVRPRRDVLGS